MILVTGATGTVGREVVAQLLAAGEKVRALTRDPGKTRFDGAVEVVKGDLSQPETLLPAVQGADKIFSLALGLQIGEQERSLAQIAKKAGVRQIVKLSVLGVGEGQASTRAIAEWHAAGERAIEESGVPWTFVRPGRFMSNAMMWRDPVRNQGKVFSNFADGKSPAIHPKDIAAVAVQALTTSGHEGKAYPLTGPEAFSIGEEVKILSEAVGKPIEYVTISDEQARAGMQRSGMPDYLINALLQFAEQVRSGNAAQILTTVEQVLGRKALTFKDWARENAAVFC